MARVTLSIPGCKIKRKSTQAFNEESRLIDALIDALNAMNQITNKICYNNCT